MLTLAAGAVGIVISWGIVNAIGTLPLMGALFEDESGKADLHLVFSTNTVLVSTALLMFVGLVSGMVPARKASRLDPVEALRYE